MIYSLTGLKTHKFESRTVYKLVGRRDVKGKVVKEVVYIYEKLDNAKEKSWELLRAGFSVAIKKEVDNVD